VGTLGPRYRGAIDRPVIAITGPRKGAIGPRGLVALAVRFYGGIPLQLRPGDSPRQGGYDGVVITGGHDVDPVLYASEPEVEPRHDKARDIFELEVITYSLDNRLPLLGICRGSTAAERQARWQSVSGAAFTTSSDVEPLNCAAAEDPSECRINSQHNQAINRCGHHLGLLGRDLDGIV